MRAAPVVALGLLLAGLSLAAATHSASPCPGEVTTYTIGPQTFYLLREPNGDTWLYQETNDHPGLQRGGDPWYAFGTGTAYNPCWDVDLATGYNIHDPDFAIL